MRLNTYCAARADSLHTLVGLLHERVNEIPLHLRSGDIASTQAGYDMALWAVEDLGSSVARVVERCEAMAPRLTDRLQTAASQLRTSWLATQGACVSEYARRGIDCDRHSAPGGSRPFSGDE